MKLIFFNKKSSIVRETAPKIYITKVGHIRISAGLIRIVGIKGDESWKAQLAKDEDSGEWYLTFGKGEFAEGFKLRPVNGKVGNSLEKGAVFQSATLVQYFYRDLKLTKSNYGFLVGREPVKYAAFDLWSIITSSAKEY